MKPFACLFILLSPLPTFAQGISPDSIAGQSALMVITSGSGIFASIGSGRAIAARTGNTYALTALTSTVVSEAGTYTYTKTGSSTAVAVLTSSTIGFPFSYALTFTTNTSASFVLANGLGTQRGLFVLEGGTLAPMQTGLSNMSVRAVVPAGGTVIPGLVLDAPTRVLVRVAGPALTTFGVTGTLANPKFLLQGGALNYAQSDDWSDTAANQTSVQAAGAAVGAFPFAAGSKDAAAVVDLPAGNYTCLISGDAGTSGEILLEVYRVPR
ncbi:MAG: hypothetical protein HZA93_09830 [Verrucomicrobia bacterium]|nr:hypothetical protein [Verrucomicrobiota bacterium]